MLEATYPQQKDPMAKKIHKKCSLKKALVNSVFFSIVRRPPRRNRGVWMGWKMSSELLSELSSPSSKGLCASSEASPRLGDMVGGFT